METGPEFNGARLFARIAHDVAGHTGYARTAQRVVQLAQDLTRCDVAAIWSLTPAGQPVLKAASDPAVGDLTAVVEQERNGMVMRCLHENTTMRVDDFQSDSRWALHRRWWEDHGRPMSSSVGYSLRVGDHIEGTLVLWSQHTRHFTENQLNVGTIFAEHAAIILKLASVREQAENLQEALQSNRRIGIALGIIMIEYRVAEQAAFDMLRMISQNSHRKLRDVAEEVALTGVLPDIHLAKLA